MVIVGFPTGFDEVWILGDSHFLAQSKKTLENLRDADAFDNTNDRRKLIYLLDNFEVIMGTFHFSWCITTQIKGGLNYLLSTRWKLPNYIYILFSNDQVEDSEILGGEMYKVLNELFVYIGRSLIERKTILPKKARRFRAPIITVVKTAAKLAENLEIDDFKIKRRTLNRAIQKEAANMQWRSINIDSILPTNKDNFTTNGEDLSDEGFNKMWNFISDDLQQINSPVGAQTNRKFHHKSSPYQRNQKQNI